MRTLLVASGGGHLTDLVELRHRLPFDPGHVTWFTEDSVQSRSLLHGERVVHCSPSPPRDWRAVAANERRARRLLRREPFDVVVSTGASVALAVLPAAARTGAATHYVECSARVDGPSLTGRILARCPGVRTHAQYPGWTRDWRVAGSVFDGYEPGPVRPVEDLRRVVVTVGTQPGHPFQRLVEALVRILPQGVDVLWQTGCLDPAPYGLAGVAQLPQPVLEAAMAEADVVVAHAGVGSALSALSAGRHPVLVPRRRDMAEHVDDHQRQIAHELSRRGLATLAAPGTLTMSTLRRAARCSVARATTPLPLAL